MVGFFNKYKYYAWYKTLSSAKQVATKIKKKHPEWQTHIISTETPYGKHHELYIWRLKKRDRYGNVIE
jgi:hypothetical protein